jgi:ribosomal protein S18 acetylase RimI-like enzyme
VQVIAEPSAQRASSDESFVQTITLRDGQTVIARGLWHAARDGTSQILELHVHPEHRRKGHGSRVMQEIFGQIPRVNAARRGVTPVRVIYAVVAQKAQIQARAFLGRHGFHHAATSKHLYLDDEAMVYAKAFT